LQTTQKKLVILRFIDKELVINNSEKHCLIFAQCCTGAFLEHALELIQTEISVVGCMVRASARQNFDGDGRTPIDNNAVYGDLDKSDA
jgi:hypothetical protein